MKRSKRLEWELLYSIFAGVKKGREAEAGKSGSEKPSPLRGRRRWSRGSHGAQHDRP